MTLKKAALGLLEESVQACVGEVEGDSALELGGFRAVWDIGLRGVQGVGFREV